MIKITRWVVAIVLYIQIILILLVVKPALLFDSNGNPKDFGTGLKEGKSIFAPAFVFPLIALLCYIISTWINVIWV